MKETILEDLQSSEFFSLMTDESTDIGVLKQLVLVGRYVSNSGVKTSFLYIRDIVNGRAETVEGSILHTLSDMCFWQ